MKKKAFSPKSTFSLGLGNEVKKRSYQSLSLLFRTIESLPGRIKRYLLGSFMLLLALVSLLSFFDLAGQGGVLLKKWLFESMGQVGFGVPLLFILAALSFLCIPKRLIFSQGLVLALILLAMTGLFEALEWDLISGGSIGQTISNPVLTFFGSLVALAAFAILMMVGILSFWYILSPYLKIAGEKETMTESLKEAGGLPHLRVLPLERSKLHKEREPAKEPVSKELALEKKGKPLSLEFIQPPLELLDSEPERVQSGDVKQNAFIIKKTLENFGIEVAMAQANTGPTVTQYTFKPAEGVRLSKITALSNNLALALASHPIRIEAPIPGQSLVGVEVPNKTRGRVRLKDLLLERDFQGGQGLVFALGKDVAGRPIFGELSRLPHLLVAGATGTGKTIFLNSLIVSLIYKHNPQTLRFILVDPKRVEFVVYQNLPHLLAPVIFDGQKTVQALKWLVAEMERRFHALAEQKVRNLASYNEVVVKKGEEPMPYIVLIIDELADLMASRGKEMEAGIVRLAQMARAVGIHLVVATQRPSVEVLTGLIKANITARIGFQVATQFDARTILDTGGAEKLLGQGDLLYISADTVKPKRVQGAYVSDKEVVRLVKWFIEKMAGPTLPAEDLVSHVQELEEEIPNRVLAGDLQDSLAQEAEKIVIQAQKASASLLQRRLQIGYARAARILDILEAKGVVGPSRGAKPRRVFVAREGEDFGPEE